MYKIFPRQLDIVVQLIFPSGHGEDIVKLYDLSTLCSEYLENDKNANPFTVPVGILLYRVARNMRQTLGR